MGWCQEETKTHTGTAVVKSPRKAPYLEEGRNGIWYQVLHANYSIFGIKYSQQCISYKIFKILFLVPDAAFMFLGLRDKIWPCLKNSEISDATYIDCTGNTEPVRPVEEPITVNSNIHLPQREPDEKDDSTVSFFTSPVHISHWYRPLSTMKVPNYSLSTFSFSLLSTLRPHTRHTQYLKYRKPFFP